MQSACHLKSLSLNPRAPRMSSGELFEMPAALTMSRRYLSSRLFASGSLSSTYFSTASATIPFPTSVKSPSLPEERKDRYRRGPRSTAACLAILDTDCTSCSATKGSSAGSSSMHRLTATCMRSMRRGVQEIWPVPGEVLTGQLWDTSTTPSACMCGMHAMTCVSRTARKAAGTRTTCRHAF